MRDTTGENYFYENSEAASQVKYQFPVYYFIQCEKCLLD